MRGQPSLETGTPRRIRTPDPLIRSQMLYPAELATQMDVLFIPADFVDKYLAGAAGAV